MLATMRHTRVQDLWTAVPTELAALLRPELHSLASQIMDEIQRQIPEYARPLDGKYPHAIQRGVEEALTRFVDQIADPAAPPGRCAGVHRALGKAEMMEGRSLDSLQAAYRLGARLAWRRMAGACEKARVPARAVLLLGEAIYAHIDELAALSVEGFAQAQAQAAGTLARRRRRLLELLVAEAPTPQRTLEEEATSAEWPLPSMVTAVALERTTAHPHTSLLDTWNPLVDLECTEPHLLISSDSNEQDQIDWARELAGWRIFIGPPVELHSASHSLRWARRLEQMSRGSILPKQPLTRCLDHLSSLLMFADENLTTEIVHHRLAPLGRLKPKQRARLAETLLAWLQTRGGAPEIAQRLGVHPQTVRYRQHQLDDLFGNALNDPEARFEMELGLRGSGLLPKTQLTGSTNP